MKLLRRGDSRIRVMNTTPEDNGSKNQNKETQKKETEEKSKKGHRNQSHLN